MNRVIIFALLISLALCLVATDSSFARIPSAPRHRVRYAEKDCRTYDCFMNEIGRYGHDAKYSDEGFRTCTWYIDVVKIRHTGEDEGGGRYYKHYDQVCDFTVVFDPSGNALTTEWVGDGCWGDGN